MKFARNIKEALRDPHHIMRYLVFLLSRSLHGGEAIRSLPKGIMIGSISRYSDWIALSEILSESEVLFFETLLLRGGCILDIGANVGVTSLFFAKLFPDIPIFSFEPNLETYRQLLLNIELNHGKNITAINKAVAERSEIKDFLIVPGSAATCRLADGHSTTTVQAVSIDDFCKDREIERISLLKLDVEGYEEDIFRGATRLLSKHQIDIVYYEVCPGNCRRVGRLPEGATRLLMDSGYHIYEITNRGNLRSLDYPRASDVEGVTNWVGMAEESLQAVA
jgi:FkbM family methyltransferase